MTGIAIGTSFLAAAAFGWPPVLIVAVLVAAQFAAGARRTVAVAALIVLVAALLGAWRGNDRSQPVSLSWADMADAVSGRIVSVPVPHGDRQRFAVAIEQRRIGKRWEPATGRVDVLAPAWPATGWGDRAVLYGTLTSLTDESASYRAYLQSQGYGASMFATAVSIEELGHGWRRQVAAVGHRLDTVLAQAAPGDAGALMAGLVTGDDRMLSPQRLDAFRATGTSHITAVSGSNVALFWAIFATLGGATGWRRRLIWQALTIGVIFGYALLAGFQPPAIRAAIVAAGAIFASRFGRRPDHLTLLVLTAALMVAIEPGNLQSVSFRLSFAAASALVLVLGGFAPRGLAGWFWSALLAVIAADLATMPVLAYAGLPLAPATIPANLLIGPAVEIAFPLAALIGTAGLAVPALAAALAVPGQFIVRYVFLAVDGLAGWHAVVAPDAFSGITGDFLALSGVLGVAALSREGRGWVRRMARGARAVGQDGLIVVAAGACGAAVVIAAFAIMD